MRLVSEKYRTLNDAVAYTPPFAIFMINIFAIVHPSFYNCYTKDDRLENLVNTRAILIYSTQVSGFYSKDNVIYAYDNNKQIKGQVGIINGDHLSDWSYILKMMNRLHGKENRRLTSVNVNGTTIPCLIYAKPMPNWFFFREVEGCPCKNVVPYTKPFYLFFSYGHREDFDVPIADVKYLQRCVYIKNHKIIYNTRNRAGRSQANLIESTGCNAYGNITVLDGEQLRVVDQMLSAETRIKVQVFGHWKCKNFRVYAWCYYTPNASLAKHYRPHFESHAIYNFNDYCRVDPTLVQVQRLYELKRKLRAYDLLSTEEYLANPLMSVFIEE